METYSYLEDVILICIENSVTDIHIDLDKDYLILRQNKRFIMRYACDNMLGLFNHLKYKSRMKMNNVLSPQTGSFQYFCIDKELYLRFAAVETLTRKHGVLRILNLVVLDTMESCGIDADNIDKISNLVLHNNGLIIFAGKTGAGKSTSMYASLESMQHKQIFSLESPIERIIPSIIQIEYSEMELAKHITQLLRHDPDLLVIGEIRTSDELMHVVRASLSGHLVMTTLHAGSVEEVFYRLNDLNNSRLELMNVIKGIIYQSVHLKEEETVFEFEVYNQEDISKLKKISTPKIV